MAVAPTSIGASANAATSAIISAAQKYGVAAWVALDIAQEESGLNPNAIGDNGTSFGLFQLHWGGQGTGYTAQQLLNPQTNADIGVKNLASAYNTATARGLTGWSLLDYVATDSGHPGYGGPGAYPSYENGLHAIYNGNGGTAQTGGSSGGSGSGSSAQAPNSPLSIPSGSDPITVLNNAMKIKSFDITKPINSLTQDAGAIGLRAFLVIAGLCCVIFGMVAIVRSAS